MEPVGLDVYAGKWKMGVVGKATPAKRSPLSSMCDRFAGAVQWVIGLSVYVDIRTADECQGGKRILKEWLYSRWWMICLRG